MKKSGCRLLPSILIIIVVGATSATVACHSKLEDFATLRSP